MTSRLLQHSVLVLFTFLGGTLTLARTAEDLPRLKDKDFFVGDPHSPIASVQFSPDGKKLLSLEGASTARVWDIKERKSVATFQHWVPSINIKWSGEREVIGKGADRMFATLFTPDGKHVTTYGRDGLICTWIVNDGKKIRSFSVGRDFDPIALIYGPEGKKLTGVTKTEFRVWDVESGRKLCDYESPLIPRTRMRVPLHVVRADASIKQPLIAYGEAEGSVLLDALTAKQQVVCKHTDGIGACFAMSRDETRVAAGAYRAPRIWIWDRTSGDCLKSVDTPPILFLCITFSPDGKMLAAGYQEDYYRRDKNGKTGNSRLGGVLIYEVSTGKLLSNQDARIAAVHSVAFSPDGRLLATGDASGVIKLWSIPDAWRKKKASGKQEKKSKPRP